MPIRLISQLAHVEMLSPTPDTTAKFLVDVLGLEESGRSGKSIFLRGWGEFYYHSLQVTEAAAAGLGHIGWRASGPAELEDVARLMQAKGSGLGWVDGDAGHGRAYRYQAPGGHIHEIFWDVTRYVAPPHLVSPFPNRPQRYAPRGVGARSLDHVTIASRNIMADVEWLRDTIGHRFMEYVVHREDNTTVVFAMTTTCERGHDLGLVPDHSGVAGRVNHIAYWVDQRQDLLNAAEALMEAGVGVEFGPCRHGLGEQDFLYFRVPGGVRIEVNSGGYKNYEPDWKPVRWTHAQGSNIYYKNQDMPRSVFESFPQAESKTPLEEVAKGGSFV
jgi:catechol 2,3-dioxygenase